MLRKSIAPSLIGTVMLFTVPAKAFSQTLPKPQAADSAHVLSEAQIKTKSDLKAAFAKERANFQARTLTAGDYERIEKQRQDDESQKAAKKGWTKAEKIGLVVFIGVMTAFTIAVLIRGINTEPSCVEDPFAANCT